MTRSVGTFKTITSRVRISEVEYSQFIEMAAGILAVEPPDLAKSEVSLSVYDSRFDLDDPEDERGTRRCLTGDVASHNVVNWEISKSRPLDWVR